MSDAAPPLDALRVSLAKVLESAVRDLVITAVTDISGGLARSRVFRVHVDGPAIAIPARTLVLKVTDSGQPGAVQPGDPFAPHREQRLIGAGLLQKLPSGLSTPRIYGVDVSDARAAWIWMEDVAGFQDAAWDAPRALQAASRCALLHAFYREHQAELSTADWVSRDNWRLYAAYIPDGHVNLDAARGVARWRDLFTPDERRALHRALDAFDWPDARFRSLPTTFVHGDFHIRNVAFRPDGTLTLLDWAHAGLAPLGTDIATFASVYEVFGGTSDVGGESLGRQMLTAYTAAVHEVGESRRLTSDIEMAWNMWHLTWGLHLRLGPGLGALLRDVIQDERQLERTVADIRQGCAAALKILRSRGYVSAP